MKPNDKAKRNNIGSARPPQKLARQLHGHAFHYSPASFELTLGLHPALAAVGACCAGGLLRRVLSPGSFARESSSI